MADMTYRRRYRSVFISDVHLGARACKAEALLAFLDGVECDRLYLLGDIVDGWRLERGWFWPASHAAVVERVFALARSGVAVTYVPGNHDAFARSHGGFSGWGFSIAEEAEHLAADGRRYLLVHGDVYDPSAGDGAASRWIGDIAYRLLMRMDGVGRAAGRALGVGEASLAAWAKRRSGTAQRVVAAFEAALAEEARRRGYDGVVCGHIHSAAARQVDGLAYVNCGDWVETCSAVGEGFDGRFEVLSRPAERRPHRRPAPAATPTPAWSG